MQGKVASQQLPVKGYKSALYYPLTHVCSTSSSRVKKKSKVLYNYFKMSSHNGLKYEQVRHAAALCEAISIACSKRCTCTHVYVACVRVHMPVNLSAPVALGSIATTCLPCTMQAVLQALHGYIISTYYRLPLTIRKIFLLSNVQKVHIGTFYKSPMTRL